MVRKKGKAKFVKLNLLKNSGRFSVLQLITFIVVFAGIGGYLTYRSFAYSTGDPPTAPTNLTVSLVNSSETYLHWGASSSGSVSTLYYSIYRNNSLVTTTTALTYYNSGLAAGTTYSYFVTAHDQFGTSPASNTVSITTPTPPPPTAPTSLSGQAVSYSEIDLSWGASSSSGGVYGYQVFRNNNLIATVSSTSYKNTGLSGSATYSYYVAAYNAYGTSGPSNTISVTTPAAPSPVTAPILSGQAVSYSEIDLNWTASSSPGGISGYSIYRNSVLIASTEGSSTPTSYKDTGLSASTSYSYYVTAYSVYGTSPASNTVSITTPAAPPPPSAPASLTAVVMDDTEIDLSWSASTSSVGIGHYNIYRNSSLVGSTTSTTISDTGSSTAYYDTGLSAATSYTYYVVAVDKNGTSSTPSGSVSSRTQSNIPPSAPTAFSAKVISSSTVTLSWQTSTLGQVGLKNYDIYKVTPPDATDDNGVLDGTLIGSTTSTSYQVIGLNASTSYGFYVIAVDTTGNFSEESTEAIATTNAAGYTITVSTSASVTEIGNNTTGVVLNWAVTPSSVKCTKKFATDGSATDPSWSGSFSGLAGGSQTVYPPSGSTYYRFYSYELSCTNGSSTAVSGIDVRSYLDAFTN